MLNFFNMVYLIDLGTCYKIGITNNIKSRINTFRNSREIVIPIDVIVYPKNTIDIDEIDRKIEIEIHDLCKKFKIERELFQKVPEVVDIFKNYKINIVKDLNDWTKYLKNLDTNNSTNNSTNSSNLPKKVYQYDFNGNLVKIWNSIYSINKEMGIDIKGVRNTINGIYAKSHGYIWSGNELSKEELDIKINKAKKYNNVSKILQYSKDRKTLLNTYNTLTEASIATGVSTSGIALCYSGKYSHSGGYFWVKEEII